MSAVIFEVRPKAERWDDYLELAKLLRPEIERVDGFIDNERFASRRTEGRLLSLSTWRDAGPGAAGRPAAAPPGPRHSGLWHGRPPRGAAVLSVGVTWPHRLAAPAHRR